MPVRACQWGRKTASGDGGPATAARLVKPSGLALDTVGNLYIADEHSCTVRMVAANTGIITTVAGSSANAGHAGDGGPGDGVRCSICHPLWHWMEMEICLSASRSLCAK